MNTAYANLSTMKIISDKELLSKPVLPLSFQHKYCVCVQGSISRCSTTFIDLDLLTSDYTVFSKPKLFYKPSLWLQYFS